MTWYSDAARKTLAFSVSIGIGLVFVWMAEISKIPSVGDRSFMNEQKRSVLQIPVSAD